MIPLKAEVVHTGKYRILALPFGGPIKGKDLDGEYFSQRTDPKPDWFRERPVIFHHGLDPWLGDDLIGREGPITKAGDGWWAEMWLDKAHRYFDQIHAMIERGGLYGSSGSAPHLVKKAADGELLVWPHIEQTLSPVPRNPYSVVRATKALDDYSKAGLDISPAALQSLSPDLRLQTSATGEDAAKAASDALHGLLGEVRAFAQKLEQIADGSRDSASDR